MRSHPGNLAVLVLAALAGCSSLEGGETDRTPPAGKEDGEIGSEFSLDRDTPVALYTVTCHEWFECDLSLRVWIYRREEFNHYLRAELAKNPAIDSYFLK